MAHALALQWSLDETTDHFLRVGRNLIRAATIDNVQPLAIMACEKFGATLAICPVTRLKVEKLIRSQTSSVAVAFLKATVGFANGGTILELSKSLAGLNFLALAAALVSIMTTFNAAGTIQMMIMDSAADKTLVPTTYQLKDLLDVIEPRLNRIGFLTDVLAWKDWWVRNKSLDHEDQEMLREFGGAIPSTEGILKVVAALREVSRIGEAKMVNITAGENAPWLTAFLKWCLGEPPIICTSAGQCLLDESGIPVTLLYANQGIDISHNGLATYHELQIDILTAFDKFTHVITSPEGGEHRLSVAGMVDIQSHAGDILSLGSMDNPLRYSALMEALPYALDQVRNNWRLERGNTNDVFGPNAFPNETIITSVMRRYLSLPDTVRLQSLPQNSLISDLPLLRAYAENSGEMNHLLKYVSEVAADIISLSLFNGSLESLLVYRDSNDGERCNRGFAKRINAILHSSTPQPSNKYSLEIVLGWALELVRHDVATSLRINEWAGSSSHGQVVFPRLFEERTFRSSGYLELFAIPGVLTLPGQGFKTFPLVKSIPALTKLGAAKHPEPLPEPITQSLSLYSKEELLWKVQPQEDCLLISMGWTRDHNRASPSRLLENVASAIFVNPCSHADSEIANEPLISYDSVKLTEPASRLDSYNRAGSKGENPGPLLEVFTYPVAGNQGLRMLALATVSVGLGGVSAVVNNGACLNCLLEQCRAANRAFLIP